MFTTLETQLCSGNKIYPSESEKEIIYIHYEKQQQCTNNVQ